MERVSPKPKKPLPSINIDERSLNKPVDDLIKSTNLIDSEDQNSQDIQTNVRHDVRSITGSYYNDGHSGLDIHPENQTNKTNKNFPSTSETSQMLQSTPKVFKNNKLQISPLSKVSNNYESNGIKYSPSKNSIADYMESEQLESTMENIEGENTEIDELSIMPRRMSRSFPDFGNRTPRARTVSERAEEKDMVRYSLFFIQLSKFY